MGPSDRGIMIKGSYRHENVRWAIYYIVLPTKYFIADIFPVVQLLFSLVQVQIAARKKYISYGGPCLSNDFREIAVLNY
jgi:hypothetical protein